MPAIDLGVLDRMLVDRWREFEDDEEYVAAGIMHTKNILAAEKAAETHTTNIRQKVERFCHQLGDIAYERSQDQ